MTPDEFQHPFTERIALFGKAVAEDDGDWVVKGFIDIWKNIYSISVDTKPKFETMTG